MRRTKRRSLQLERLESRALLATLHPVSQLSPTIQVLPLGNVLNGTTTGSYVTVAANRLGNAVAINGAGSLGVLGNFRVFGVVGGIGGAYGQAGQIVLSDAAGTIVLQVAGQPSSGPLHYTIVRGTGAFGHATGTGNVVLTGLSNARARGMVNVTVAPTPPPPTVSDPPTGIQVTIDLGPTTPVVHQGQSDTAPFAGALVQIQPPRGGPVVAQGTTDSTGSFSADLTPGTYLVVPMAPALYPGGRVPPPQLVTVVANAMTSVTFDYDTGMR
jgi:hypothetical protein